MNTKKRRVIGIILIMVMILELIIPTISIGEDMVTIYFPDKVLYDAIIESPAFDGTYLFTKRFLKVKGEQAIKMSKTEIERTTYFGYCGTEGAKISNLSGLEIFENLKTLNLTNNEISDIELLGNLGNLTQLELGCNRISYLTGLEGLKNLTYLELSYNDINDIGSLSGLTKLEKLYLGNYDNSESKENRISSIGSLSGLRNLKLLDISNNNVSGIIALSGLTHLDTLYLEGNAITDISSLSELKNLYSLNLSRNKISSIEPLEKLTNLVYLKLNNNNIDNLKPISGLNKLKRLNLGENEIDSIDDLSSLIGLNTLRLNNNKIENLDGLSKLSSLEDLDVSYNLISKITGISDKENMTTLNLSHNKISDISNLSNLPKLRELDLSYNKISDISVFSKLSSFKFITKLDLSANNISDIDDLLELIVIKKVLMYKDISDFSMNENVAEIHCSVGDTIELPSLFTKALDESSIVYAEYGLSLENCEFANDGKSVKIKSLPAGVYIINGNAELSRLKFKDKDDVESDDEDEENPDDEENFDGEDGKDSDGEDGKKSDSEDGKNEEKDSESDKKEKKEFMLGRDNNSFDHSNDEDVEIAGFKGVKNYRVPEKYYNALTKGATEGEKMSILSEEECEWGGSCYGVSTMMGLALYEKINLEEVQKGVKNFFDLDLPYKNEDLLYMLQYYYLSQCLESSHRVSKSYYKQPTIYNDHPEFKVNRYKELNRFLQAFIKELENEGVMIFSYKWLDEELYGHSILACGCEKSLEGDYIVKLYDLNTVDTLREAGCFSNMIIKNDFSEFYFEDGKVTMDNLDGFEWKKISDCKILNLDEINKEENETKENTDTMKVTCKNSSSFSIENSKNQTLSYNGNKFSGDMEVLDLNTIVHGDTPAELQITIPYDEQITYTANSSNTDFDIYDDKNFVAITGENLSKATIDLDEYVKVEGENSNVKVQMDNVGDGLYEVNTQIEKNITLTRQDDDIIITSEQKLNNTEINEINPEEKRNLANGINAQNITIDKEGNVTVINDKKVEEITISKLPDKRKYVYLKDSLDVTGGEIKVVYDDATEETIEITNEMVTGFDNTKLGKETLTVTYEEKTATYEIEIVEDNTDNEIENETDKLNGNNEQTNNFNNNNQNTENENHSGTNEENKDSIEKTSNTPTTGDKIERAIMILCIIIVVLCASYGKEKK